MFLPRLENQGWTKTWLGPDFKVRAGPRLGPGPPTRPADSGTFFWAPFEARNAKSGFLSTKFDAVPGNAANNIGSAGSTLFEEVLGNATKHVQKKVPEWGPEKSSGIGRPGWEVQASSCLSRPCSGPD